MACIITYENKQYTQKEFEQYFKEHFTEFVDNFLGSKQDIEGFKEFVDNSGKSNLFKDGKLTIGKHTITEKEFNAMTKDEQNNLRECL